MWTDLRAAPPPRRRPAARRPLLLLAGLLAGGALFPDDSAGQARVPLSAIDWLSDSLSTPIAPPRAPSSAPLSPQSRHGGDVTVSPLSGTSADAVGILPAAGLPAGLWGKSRTEDLIFWLSAERPELLPAMRDLLYTLLLAELEPPSDAGPDARLLLARIDRLLVLGALPQAGELLESAGQDSPSLFRRAFDIALLLRREDAACARLRARPALSPTFPARIFCLARGGDWNAAALSLEVGSALGHIPVAERELLARFLDPLLFENAPRLPPPERMSPLKFRLLEAIGEPLPTAGLPVAFAWADLDHTSGWKNQIEAAERLVRNGALDPNRLLGLYTERRPAASGGIWERVSRIQALEGALARSDARSVGEALAPAWEAMRAAELEIAFAQLFAHRLARLELPGAAARLAFEIGLLSDRYKAVAAARSPEGERAALLRALALGRPGPVQAAEPLAAALQDGFRAEGIPLRLRALAEGGRLGEAILRAIELMNSGAQGELDELSDAIAFFRAVGLEDTARRAALQILILERRG